MAQDMVGFNNYTDPSGTRNSLADVTAGFRALVNSGGVISGLEVTETGPQSSSVQIAAGLISIDCGTGELLIYRLKTATTLPIVSYQAGYYTLICLKVDLNNATNTFVAVAGNGSYTDPSLTEGSGVYYQPIARVVPNGVATITNAMITTTGNTNNASVEQIRAYVKNLRKDIQVTAFAPTTNVATGNGAAYYEVGQSLEGYKVVKVDLLHTTAGTGTSLTGVNIYNMTKTSNILSTVASVDSTELSTSTAATSMVVDTAHNTVNEYDVLRFDVATIPASTAPKGLIIRVTFQRP